MEIQHSDKVLKRAYFTPKKTKKKRKGKFGRIARGFLTGGASEIVRNRKKIGKGLGKIGKIAAGAALLPALLPLMPIMAGALKAKGLKPSRKPRQLAEQFYTQIVKKNSHYDKPDTSGEDHFLPLAAIVPPIITFIKRLIAKKKTGAKLSKVEDIVATGSENVVDKIKENGGGDESSMPGSNAKDSGEGIGDEGSEGSHKSKQLSIGGLKLSTPMMLGIGGVLIVVIFFVMKKK